MIISWIEVFRNFKRRHPNLSKLSASYAPRDYAEILVYLKDSSKLTYNYDTRRVRFNVVPHISNARSSQAVL